MFTVYHAYYLYIFLKIVCICLFRSEEENLPSAESTEAGEGSSSSDPKKLPSFISLSSSPDPTENTDAPEFPPAAGPQAKGVYVKEKHLTDSVCSNKYHFEKV